MLQASEGTLKLSGYLRGSDLSADRLVHVVGWGTYQIAQIDSATDPHPLVLHKPKSAKVPASCSCAGAGLYPASHVIVCHVMSFCAYVISFCAMSYHFVFMGVKQGDSGQLSKPVGLINFVVDNFYNCFY